MKKDRKRILGLSQSELNAAPAWIRLWDKMRWVVGSAFIGAVFFIIVALVAGKRTFPVPLVGLIICGSLIGLGILTIQIGFLVETWKNGHTGYFFLILLLGPVFWGEYSKKVIKPRLAESARTIGRSDMGGTELAEDTKKIYEKDIFDERPERKGQEELLCEECGNTNFEYDEYWEEYTCKQCGWITRRMI